MGIWSVGMKCSRNLVVESATTNTKECLCIIFDGILKLVSGFAFGEINETLKDEILIS